MIKRQLFSAVTAAFFILGYAGLAIAGDNKSDDLLIKLSKQGNSLQVGDSISAYHIRYQEYGNQADRGGVMIPYKHQETQGVVVEVQGGKDFIAKLDKFIPTNEKVHFDVLTKFGDRFKLIHLAA